MMGHILNQNPHNLLQLMFHTAKRRNIDLNLLSESDLKFWNTSQSQFFLTESDSPRATSRAGKTETWFSYHQHESYSIQDLGCLRQETPPQLPLDGDWIVESFNKTSIIPISATCSESEFGQ